VESKLAQRIEEALADLVGQPLLFSNRAADMEMFHFGTPHVGRERGRESRWGDYALHVQCFWRLVGPGGIMTGYSDLWRPPSDHLEWRSVEFDHELGNRRDECLAEFYAAEDDRSRIVRAIAADHLAGVRITLGGSYELEIIPEGSTPDGEHWRFIGIEDPESPHFVVLGSGIE
jgi:hypothetical protein